MPAAHYDITIEQGATFELPLSFQVESSSVNPTLITMDLTGYTARSQVRDYYDHPTVLAEMTVDFGTYGSGILTGSVAASGSIVLSLTADQTEALPPIHAVWDLKLYIGSEEIRVLNGEARIRPSVTRP
jgi:hypothetical protein